MARARSRTEPAPEQSAPPLDPGDQGRDWEEALEQRTSEVEAFKGLGLTGSPPPPEAEAAPDAGASCSSPAAASEAPREGADPDLFAFVRGVVEALADQFGVGVGDIVQAFRLLADTDASAARMAAVMDPLPHISGCLIPPTFPGIELRACSGLGSVVLFREHGRRFNGSPTSVAIITHIDDDQVASLMVLPDGAEPYPRQGVRFEPELDPDALGRAWSHLPPIPFGELEEVLPDVELDQAPPPPDP